MTILKKIRSVLFKLKIKEIPNDIFIQRLRSLVVGDSMLHEGNIYLMDVAIKNMPTDGVVIEIGSYGGLSTNLLLHLLQKNDRQEKLINCDPWLYEGHADRFGTTAETIDASDDISRKAYTEYMKNNFMNSVQFLHKNNPPHTFQLTSDAFFKAYDQKETIKDIFNQTIQLGTAISFAYIDGNHAYEYVKRDFENVDKHLLKSGFILFDDSADNLQFGSVTFMKEMMQHKNYQLVEKNPNYLFQKIN